MYLVFEVYQGSVPLCGPCPIRALPQGHFNKAAPKCISGSTSYNPVWLAFHPYPHVIQILFNVYWFGPPRSVTYASSCTWIDHRVSRMPQYTLAYFKLAFATTTIIYNLNLAYYAQLVGSLNKRHEDTTFVATSVCKHVGSGSISLPS